MCVNQVLWDKGGIHITHMGKHISSTNHMLPAPYQQIHQDFNQPMHHNS